MAIYFGEFETKFITYLKFSGDHSEYYMVQFSPETMNHTYVLYLLYYVVYYLLQRILLISQVFIYSTYFSGKIFFALWTIWHQSG